MAERERHLEVEKAGAIKSDLTHAGPVIVPAVDIYENREALILIADMPGVGADGVDIHLKDHELTIRGRLLEKRLDPSPIRTEFESGTYYRSFTLHPLIDQVSIEATMKDGVLRIVLPKAEGAKPRKITVKAT